MKLLKVTTGSNGVNALGIPTPDSVSGVLFDNFYVDDLAVASSTRWDKSNAGRLQGKVSINNSPFIARRY